jgi:hypothetical protein
MTGKIRYKVGLLNVKKGKYAKGFGHHKIPNMMLLRS